MFSDGLIKYKHKLRNINTHIETRFKTQKDENIGVIDIKERTQSQG